jgi:CheY-like chemotaxis protein
VVEDEELVRMMAVDMLQDEGFTVIEAASADAALTILENRDDIGVLFTDIDMPGSMNGFALAQQVAERWPRIRLVLTSGRFTPKNRDVPDSGQFVPKPYLPDQLLTAFRNAG